MNTGSGGRSPRVRCSAKKCRANIKLVEFELEYPRADAWAQVFSVANKTMYLCPLHRMQLKELGEVRVEADLGRNFDVGHLRGLLKDLEGQRFGSSWDWALQQFTRYLEALEKKVKDR